MPWKKPPWQLALGVAAVAVVAKLVASKKAAWQGLTETELREKLDSRLPDRIPEEKRAAVADKVVANMEKRGALRPDEGVTLHDASEDAADGDPELGDDDKAEDTESS